jgi:hypothetical protein
MFPASFLLSPFLFGCSSDLSSPFVLCCVSSSSRCLAAARGVSNDAVSERLHEPTVSVLLKVLLMRNA